MKIFLSPLIKNFTRPKIRFRIEKFLETVLVSKHCSIIGKHAKFEPDRTNRTGVMTKNVRSVRRRKKERRRRRKNFYTHFWLSSKNHNFRTGKKFDMRFSPTFWRRQDLFRKKKINIRISPTYWGRQDLFRKKHKSCLWVTRKLVDWDSENGAFDDNYYTSA